MYLEPHGIQAEKIHAPLCPAILYALFEYTKIKGS